MVLLTITAAAKRAIEEYNTLDQSLKCNQNDEPSLVHPAVGSSITHAQLIDVVRTLQKHKAQHEDSTNSVDLETVLKGAQIYRAPPAIKPIPKPEYVALMKRLREQEEARQYERMINQPPPQESLSQRFPAAAPFGASAFSSPVMDEADEITYQDVDRQMALIINVLVSIIACSVFIWVAARYWSTPQRLALSMTGSGVVAIAEVAIYQGYIRRMKIAKKDESKKVESKEIISSWVIDANREKDSKDPMRFRKGRHK